ncbi:MAG: DJ-1/PfpI family protein [Candidatus Bilamarchaeaceae archaeon]
MARILLVLADGFLNAEYKIKTLLERKGHDVRVASKQRITITSKDGEKIMPDLALYEINPDYFDFVIIAGQDMKKIITPETINAIRKCAAKKGVAGVNEGAVALAFAGILNGKNATVAREEKSIKFLRDSGAKYKNEEIVLDGNILTAAYPEMVEEIADNIDKIVKK